jgi:putative tryptophan/tyrosine transport system substrate-binding protein
VLILRLTGFDPDRNPAPDSEQFRSAQGHCQPVCAKLKEGWFGVPMFDMRRRDVIALLGGAAAWPLAARAQQTAMPVIGFLRSSSISDAPHLITAFRQGLKELGFVESQNVAVEYHAAENDRDLLRSIAAELIRRPVAIIVANQVSALVAKASTTTVPVVFATGSDPVRDGLVAALNRPGGNVTGVVFFGAVVGAKRLELLRQLVPKATPIAVLVGLGKSRNRG